MRLHILIPQVQPDQFVEPTQCPQPGCKGKQFFCRQIVPQKVRDPVYAQVQARRYECLSCGHTFRVYPQGVSQALTSARIRGAGVMLD